MLKIFDKIPHLPDVDFSPMRLFSHLIISLISIFFLGTVFFFVSSVVTILNEPVQGSGFCLSSNCLNNFAGYFSGSFLIVKATIGMLTIVATAGGVLIALLNYLQNVESSTQSNSIAHMNLFLAQARQEVAARHRLSPDSFDLLCWYNAAFLDASNGRKLVSNEYIALLEEINTQIDRTNDDRLSGANRVDFVDHQIRLQRALKPVGIYVTSYPKSDFFEIEDQIFDLLTAINQSFCRPRYDELRLLARDYR